MEFKNLFESFNQNGKLVLSDKLFSLRFGELCFNEHPDFEGVFLKHIITSKQTNGMFSYHLVKIEPNKKIGEHIHKNQFETHEIISGNGVCVNNGTEIIYRPGIISILEKNTPHKIIAGDNGLYIFAKFIPALC